MIPKVIHYCWFGGKPLPEFNKKCIDSWKKFCPDYKIIEWNESNYDVQKNLYMAQAYEREFWGFVSDYARLDILNEHGGIYLDVDVELIKPLDPLLINAAFVGFEDGIYINTGLIVASEKNNPSLSLLMHTIYDRREFVDYNGKLNTTPCPIMNTEYLVSKGLIVNDQEQVVDGITIYPSEYFCPKNYQTGELIITENTYSIHHFDGSWLSDEEKYRDKLRYKFVKVLPLKISKRLAKLFAALKYRGVRGVLDLVKNFIKKMRS